MKRKFPRCFLAIILFVLSILLSWGGMIYASIDVNNFKPGGIFIALLGYGLLFVALYFFEFGGKPEE